jgi:hypothetical protein
VFHSGARVIFLQDFRSDVIEDDPAVRKLNNRQARARHVFRKPERLLAGVHCALQVSLEHEERRPKASRSLSPSAALFSAVSAMMRIADASPISSSARLASTKGLSNTFKTAALTLSSMLMMKTPSRQVSVKERIANAHGQAEAPRVSERSLSDSINKSRPDIDRYWH